MTDHPPADHLPDLSDDSLARAIVEHMPGYLEWLLGSPALAGQVEFHAEPDVTWALTPYPDPLFNEVMRARFLAEAAARIEAILQRYSAAGLPVYWWVAPGDQPADLRQRLVARHFIPVNSMTGMAMPLAALPESVPAPAGLRIERVGDEAGLRAWLDVVRTGFGYSGQTITQMAHLLLQTEYATSPANYCYLARQDGSPAATASLIVRDGVAGIYSVATLPEYQRRGIATAITHRALAGAHALGCRAAILHATRQGTNVYLRLGFKPLNTVRLYWRQTARQR